MDVISMQPELECAEQVWFRSTAGMYLQQQEQALYDEAVFDLFGFNALQMGTPQMDLLRNSRIPKRYLATDCTVNAGHLRCADDFLPFAEASLDLLLLPHRLEFSERPHQTLREAARVMMPDGHLLISGFNPWSSWGLKSNIKKGFKRSIFNQNNEPEPTYPWHGRFIRLGRLKDWLALLGFEVMEIKMLCHVPPFRHPQWLNRLAGLDHLCTHSLKKIGCDRLGGVYFIVAKKRVPGMTPLKPHWKTSPLSTSLIKRPSRPKPTQHEQT
jgi:SAM-dependent methyltransferase